MSLEHASSKTFSDSWHRVASVRAGLRNSVIAHRQFFRGQAWVVLRDRFSSDWYRISPEAYRFLCRLSLQQSIGDVWESVLQEEPEGALTQEEVVQLIGQMNLANLLQYDRTSGAASFFARMTKRKSAEFKALLMGVLSIKLPLWDPDRFLDRAMPLIRWLFSPVGLAAYLMLLIFGAKSVMDNADRLFTQTAGVLAPSNLVLLYVGFLLSKMLHELGHAAACKRFGGEVHKLGVMFLIFAPMPYVDATAAWGFRSRAERLLVGLAGVIVELGLASLAAILWSQSAPGTLNSLAYNIIFVASVSTAIFNLNPLLRFDGYHMLVDTLDMPNLFQRSREQLRYLGERYLLRISDAEPAARTPTEAWLLPLYGVASMVYWLGLIATIIFFVAGEYLDLGIALAILLMITSLIVPLVKFVKYLAASPRLGHQRARAASHAVGIACMSLIVLALIPMPDRVRVMGVVEAVNSRQLHSDTEGLLTELFVMPGNQVQADQPLLRLRNDELAQKIRATEMERHQLIAQEIRAITQAKADVMSIRGQREAVEKNLLELNRRYEALVVRAPIDGVWSGTDLDIQQGQWVGRGMALGTLIDKGDWRFVAVLPQVAGHVLNSAIDRTEVRLRGQEGVNLQAQKTAVFAFEQGLLPSPALGMAGGGVIAVASSDPSGRTAAEPFFRVEALLSEAAASGQVLVHGRIGMMRLTLPSKPLLSQWNRDLRQFLQRRFRI